MKKQLQSIIVVLLLLVSFARAQGLTIGPNIGLNIANIGGKDAPSYLGSKVGIMFGGYLNYPFAKMFALEPAINYTMLGASGSTQGVNVTVSANYIEVPVLLRFYIPLEGRQTIRPSIYAGPAIGLNLSANVNQQANGQSQDTDIGKQTKSMDLSLVFGGGVAFKLGTGNLDLSLRYTVGLTTTDNSGNNQTITANAFAIVAQYGFSIR